ncbi:unnamed protein product [Blepharisma stoltei]|uniref:Thiamin pyrophosphokinase thiamin-binding domain-containing protein n=1 Tax=Blepharisma stoltei TaxID=1481888 RepID=A0AAU9JT49_9CILI|nr:unnamed protein product [Blepharisma stoltei]
MLKSINLSWIYNDEEIDLVVLDICGLEDLYLNLHPRAKNIIVTDAASNSLKDFLAAKAANKLPTKIVGDMNHITQETKQFFSGVQQICDPDQCTTDCEKSLCFASDERPVIILGDLAGRMDQSFYMLSIIFEEKFANKNLFIYNKENLALPIRKGLNKVSLIKGENFRHFGLFPVQGNTKLSTEGFKWNLSNIESEFGGLISVRNGAIENDLLIECDKAILLTCSKQ